MKLTERLNARRAHPNEPSADAPTEHAAPTAPAPDPFETDPSQARMHITAAAELEIDLRPAVVVGGPTVTTAMPCPNCGSDLRVDHLDVVARTAILSCFACGFTFSPRLRPTPSGLRHPS